MDEATGAVVLQYFHSTSADVTTVLVVLADLAQHFSRFGYCGCTA
jgi:hypothetical protein